MSHRISKILIANRGEIACRIIDTCHRMGIKTVAVYSDADKDALHANLADEAVHIGPAAAAESYLVAAKILDAARRTGADAVHPGYGFLSENPDFTKACHENSLIFIGPDASAMNAMALKGAAKKIMTDAGVPVVPGYHGDDQSIATLTREAAAIGYPVLIKAVAGGGGKGMRRVDRAEDMAAAIEAAAREGQNSFNNPKLLIEKLITRPRHIEVQVFGGPDGKAVHLFERDCSLQRRHQKVLEEAPAPGMTREMREAMGKAAVKAAEAIAYQGAGTVEFIVDVADGLTDAPFYFMEMNTRLQVEHPVTEMITGQDLVEWQIKVAEGRPLPLTQDEINNSLNGHAFEARLYAEDPLNDFLPATGTIRMFDPFTDLPENCRIDTGVTAGDHVTVHYDPMIAKLIVWGENRDMALNTIGQLIAQTPLTGLTTNRDFLARAVNHPAFKDGDVHTGFIAEHEAELVITPSAQKADYACAVAAVLAHRQAPASTDPWALQDNFRLNLPATEAFLFDRDGDTPLTATVTGQTIHIDGTSYAFTAHMDDDGYFIVDIDGYRRQLFAEVTDTHVTLILEQQTLILQRHARAGGEDDDADGPGTVIAPMPGKILDLKVTNGDRVEKGDALLVMEAMKMEQTLKAPRAGTVSGLDLSPGQLVGDSAVLLEITE